MVPQNGHQPRPQNQPPGLPSFMTSNPTFDPSPYFNNLDPTQAAKQMAALNAASQARIANSRPAPLLNLSGGTNSAPFLGGTNPPNYPAANHESMPGSSTAHAAFQMHGLPSTPNSASFLDSPMSQTARGPPHPSNAIKQRQQGFLHGLANIMAKRNTPLPPQLTGVPTPTYDPNTSQWKNLELSSEVGSFRLAGKDIDLLKLWGLVLYNNGSSTLSSNNGWAAVAAHLGLPDEIAQNPPTGGSVSAGQLIAQYYNALLYPFEEMYKRNVQEQQKRAQAMRQGATQGQQPPPNQSRPMQGGMPNSGQMHRGPMGSSMSPMNPLPGASNPTPSTMNGNSQLPQPHTPQTPHQRPSSAVFNSSAQSPSHNIPNASLTDAMTNVSNGHSADGNVLDQEMQGIKRKLDFEPGDSKRARIGTDSEPPETTPSVVADRSSGSTTSSVPASQAPTTMPPPRLRQQPSRRKIEYVPLAREVDTYGGRDLRLIDTEVASSPQRRPLRDINDWGTVDIEALTMSIRSRLSTELSYAITTFTLLSTMRGQTPGSGFPIFQSADLLDEMLDLLEEQAFGDIKDSSSEADLLCENPQITTNRELVNMVSESQTHPFSALEPHQGSKDPNLGPRQRPGNIILAILNIIRNLSIIPDNLDFISRHTRLLDLMLRLCTLSKGNPPTPASTALSLGDLVTVRKDTLYTLTNIAGNIHLSNSASSTTFRMAIRAFQLICSYLVDPVEAVSPLACIQLAGIPTNGNFKPPLLADMALDVFTRLSQADSNRQVFAKAVPLPCILLLFEALVHRLPMVDADFQLVTRDVWLSYLEKNIMAIYSLAFLAPPIMKQKVKADRKLGFRAVMLRMIHKFMMVPNHEGRSWFLISTKRAIEAMKVLDDAEDSFDTSKSAVPTMSFGMGFGEIGDKGTERGTGLLGGYRDVTLDILMMAEVHGDPVMFGELESLARIESD